MRSRSSRTSLGAFELGFLRRARECERGRASTRDQLRDGVEVAGADLALVARGRVAVLLELELMLLDAHVGGHSLFDIPARQLEHCRVQRVEARERDELELVAQLA